MQKRSMKKLAITIPAIIFGCALGIVLAPSTKGVDEQIANPQANQLKASVEVLDIRIVGQSEFEEEKNLGQTIEEDTIKYEGWTKVNLNVREKPDIKSKILETYSYNTKIEYEVYNEDWVKIQYKDSFGYLKKEYISDKKLKEKIFKPYEYSGTKLTRRLGVNFGPSGKETYYNLPMRGVIRLMEELDFDYKYWVREDGCKMYGEYIMLATDTRRIAKGTIIPTSLGWGIVCDHCESAEGYSGTWIDIAVTW